MRFVQRISILLLVLPLVSATDDHDEVSRVSFKSSEHSSSQQKTHEKKNQIRQRRRHRQLQLSKRLHQPCILEKMNKDYQDMSTLTKWQCELQGLDATESGLMFVDIEGLDASTMVNVRSGDFTLFVEGGEITPYGKLKLPSGAPITISKAIRRGPANTFKGIHQDDNNNDEENGRRKLNRMRSKAVEQHRVLAVRIRANDSVTTSSATVISDKIFGTNGDINNLRERYATCSYGELTMAPFIGQTTTGVSISNGVYDIKVSMNVVGVDDALVREEASRVLTQTLGDLPSQFDHVMLCMPPGTHGRWIGYGKYQKRCMLLCSKT